MVLVVCFVARIISISQRSCSHLSSRQLVRAIYIVRTPLSRPSASRRIVRRTLISYIFSRVAYASVSNAYWQVLMHCTHTHQASLPRNNHLMCSRSHCSREHSMQSANNGRRCALSIYHFLCFSTNNVRIDIDSRVHASIVCRHSRLKVQLSIR